MTPLHRHQIAWLSRDGWQRVLARDWDAEARACLTYWAGHQLPVVVTRQAEGCEGIALGLCAPSRWQHRRLALQVPLADVMYFDEFPTLERVAAHWPAAARESARRLGVELRACGATARVYGSHGWQFYTELRHLRESSDLDVWVGVASADQADEVANALRRFDGPARLDGEIVFAGDAAVAWREWLAWREGRTRSLLVKRLHGAATVTSLDALLEPAEVAA